MIIDGRTLTTLAELKVFVDDAVAQAKVDPARVRFVRALSLRLHKRTGEHKRGGEQPDYEVEVV